MSSIHFSGKDVISTSKNPQYNSICERMHQKIGNVLQTELYSNPLQNMTKARGIIYQALATAMNGTRVIIATTLGITPGALALKRYISMNIPLIDDWQAIHKHRKNQVNENIFRANLKQHHYQYAQGQKVLKKLHKTTKLVVIKNCLYTIERVHFNGTIIIEMCPGITKHINIRRLIPFC